MRKIILTGILILMLIASILCITVGIGGPFEIYSYESIAEKNDETTKKLNELADLKNGTFRATEGSLKKSVTDYEGIYKIYEQTASVKTEEEKNKALYGQEYDLEYLWISLGKHASDTKCDLTLEVSKNDENSSSEASALCDLKFTLVGSYSGVTDFIEKISNDQELKFIPENIKMYSEYRMVDLIESNATRTTNVENKGQKKLVLVTEFYKTNIPISQDTILEFEKQGIIQREEVKDTKENEKSTNNNSGEQLTNTVSTVDANNSTSNTTNVESNTSTNNTINAVN